VAASSHPRATRAAGQQTRAALLDAAGPLFAERGLAGVSQADIAAAAGTFPSQVTYYFGSKEAAVRRGRVPRRACAPRPRSSGRARGRGTPPPTSRAMVHTALASPALLTFVEAALLVAARRSWRRGCARRSRRCTPRASARSSEPRQARLADPRASGRGGARLLGPRSSASRSRAAAAGDTFSKASADATVQLVLKPLRGVMAWAWFG
jgi:AcrR family transcriptional regulator